MIYSGPEPTNDKVDWSELEVHNVANKSGLGVSEPQGTYVLKATV